jgi:hypothetical protein
VLLLVSTIILSCLAKKALNDAEFWLKRWLVDGSSAIGAIRKIGEVFSEHL